MVVDHIHAAKATQQPARRIPRVLLACVLAFSLALPAPALAYALDGNEPPTSPDVAATPSEADATAETPPNSEIEVPEDSQDVADTSTEQEGVDVENTTTPSSSVPQVVTEESVDDSLAITGLENSATQDDSAQPVTENVSAYNLVLLVRFAGDTTGDNKTGYNADFRYPGAAETETEWDYLRAQFNENAYVKYGLKTYLNKISGGQHNLVSLFPQTNPDGKTVEYITLPHTYDYYYGAASFGNKDFNLISDTVQLFNEQYPSFNAATFDGNKDGYIDNLLIIPTVSQALNPDDPLWPHKSQVNGAFSVGKAEASLDVDIYNIVDTQHINTETLAHEYLHTLGARDYYRKGGSGDPVSIWDVMGAGDVPRALPLAITRQAAGWTYVPEHFEAGSYTLHAFDSGSGEQAFLFKSPLNDSEYFVVEYRKQGNKYNSTDLDGFIGGSGLIVYRVNPAYAGDGNIKGNDYIYIFRPGETSLGDSSGDVKNAQVSMPEWATSASRTSIGVSDLTADITQGALCYSNGENSGIVITPTAQTDDSITFTLEYPDYEQVDLWDALVNTDGSNAMLGSGVAEAQVIADGQNTYVVLESLRRYQIMKYDGSNWSNLGSSQNAYAGLLAVKDDEVYFLAADAGTDGSIALRKYDGLEWRDVAQVPLAAGETANNLAMEFIGEDLYVLAGPEDKNVKLYRLEEQSLTDVSEILPVTEIAHPVLFELNGNPAVACGDSGAQKSYVFELANSEWAQQNVLDDGSSNVNSVAHDGDTTYVYQCQNKNMNYSPKLLTFAADGAHPGVVDVSAGPTSSFFSGSLVASDGKLYLTLFGEDPPVGSVKTFMADTKDLNTWEQFGGDVYWSANSLSSVVSQGKILVAVVNGTNGQATVRTHELPAPPGPPEPAAVLSLSHTAVPDLTYGYTTGSTVTFTLENSGTATVSDLSAQLKSGSASFTLGALANTTLAPGKTTTLTCTTNANLAAGMHAGSLRVSSATDPQVSASGSFSQKVNPLDISLGKLYEKGSLRAGVANKDWSGKAIVLNSGWRISVGSLSLPTADVALSYRNNINVGTATVAVRTTNPNFTGSFNVQFTIKKVSHWERLGGATALDTMVSISRKSYPSGSDTVIIAAFDGYWDALTASGLASFEQAPILLTQADLSAQAKQEIRRLKAKRAIIVGGSVAVSDRVEAQIRDMKLSVVRYKGQTATDTAIEVYRAKKGQWAKTAIVATADGYWDALSVAPYAYAKRAPIFLAEISDHRLSSGTLSAIREGGFTNVIIVGGGAAVSNSVEKQLTGISVLSHKRLWGARADATSLAISKYAIEQGGMTACSAGVATINGYWDALTGAALCGKNNSVLMLASPADTSCLEGMISLSATGTFLTSRKASLQHGYIFGGSVAVPLSIAGRLESMYVGAS